MYVSVLLSQFTLPHHHVQKCPWTSYFQPWFILGNMPYDMDHKQCASYLSSNPLSLIAWFLTSSLVPLNLDFLLKTGMIVFAFQDHFESIWCNIHSVSSLVPAAAAAKSLQSCPTPCDHTDGSPPGLEFIEKTWTPTTCQLWSFGASASGRHDRAELCFQGTWF